MVSLFGFVSLFIALVCISAIVVHYRIMRRRAPVDLLIAELESLFRTRLEILYNLSAPQSLLRSLCDQYIDMDLSSLLDALPEIVEAFENSSDSGEVFLEDAKEESIKADSEDCARMEALEANYKAVEDAIVALNKKIENYNNFITKGVSNILMAKVLGLSEEDFISL